jgi:hypothetical protein
MGKEETKEEGKGAKSPSATYPSQQKQILIMAALYLALFLVTLVQCPPFKLAKHQLDLLIKPPGPKHHINSHPTNYGRVSLIE